MTKAHNHSGREQYRGRLHFDRQPIKDLAELISCYGDKEFKSPLRSTIPLLSMVQDGGAVLKAILSACHFPADPSLHFEYRVDSPLGVGIPSHTDLMVRFGDEQLALECKWTEPRYETVGQWIRKPPDAERQEKPPDPDNRFKRMMGWLKLLQPHSECELHVDGFSDAVYQMVHRAASAGAGVKFPQLAYMLFTPLPDGMPTHWKQYYDDLTVLHGLLGNPSNFPFHLIEVHIVPTKAFEAIADLPKGSAKTAEIVQDALLKSNLFEFGKFQLQTISS